MLYIKVYDLAFWTRWNKSESSRRLNDWDIHLRSSTIASAKMLIILVIQNVAVKYVSYARIEWEVKIKLSFPLPSIIT